MAKEVQKKTRLTLELSEEDYTTIIRMSTEQGVSSSEILRRGLHIANAIYKEKIFISTDPNCPSKIPKSILL